MLKQEKVALWRKRFFGRQDAFASRKSYFDKKADKMVMRYHPVVRDENAELPHEKYQPLTDEWIEQHLEGTAELAVYVLQLDRTVNFGAMDFDNAHTFDPDVIRTSEFLTKHNIPHHIARSTRKGYHVYFFFNGPIEAYYVTSLLNWVYHVMGFKDDAQFNRRAMPETFPKTIAAAHLGFPIKPPMWGKIEETKRNCFVNTADELYPDQWEYLRTAQEIDVASFKKWMEGNPEIEIAEIQLSHTRGATNIREHGPKAAYVPPTKGDFMKVMQGCPAFKQIWESSEAIITHEQRVAVLSIAIHTANGLNYIRQRWPTHEAERQINYAIETNQLPWTCQAMRNNGFCQVKEICLKKRAPVEKVGGRMVRNPHNVPESEWAEPSCIRLAYELNTDDAEIVKTEIEFLKTYDGDDHHLRMGEVLRQIRRFPIEIRHSLEQTLAKSKIFKNQKELREFKAEVFKDEIQKENAAAPVVELAGLLVGEDQDGYVYYTTAADGRRLANKFTNFKVIIEKDARRHGLYSQITREFRGYAICNGRKFPIIIDSKYYDSPALVTLLREAVGTDLMVRGQDLDRLRACISSFGTRDMVSINVFETYGMRLNENKEPIAYIGGDTTVTKDDIKKDPCCFVDLTRYDNARGLGLTKLSEHEFRETATHIVHDLLKLHDPKVMFTMLAHSLQATIQSAYIPFPSFPVMWIHGLTGSGKSEACKIMAAFHGDAALCHVNCNSTPRAVETYGMLYKDTLLMLDNYKDAWHAKLFKPLLDAAYDGTVRSRLKSDGTQGPSVRVRGLILVNGEDPPYGEASALARMIIVNTTPRNFDSAELRARFARIQAMKARYPGITARFIQYMLYIPVETSHSRFREVFDRLQPMIRSEQNSSRILNNLAANYTTWWYFLDFLRDVGIITPEMHDALYRKHWENIGMLVHEMAGACKLEQASNLFIEALKEVIHSGKYYIDGVTKKEANATCLGFGGMDGNKLTRVYLFPTIADTAVRSVLTRTNSEMSHGKGAIAQQLLQDGIILDTYEGRSRVRRRYNNADVWVLSCDPARLGFGADGSPM